MSKKGTHLTLDDRKIIEDNICRGLRKFETSNELNKSQSTIGKEIKSNRKRRYSKIDNSPWMCRRFNECKVFLSNCTNFEEISCTRRDRFIRASN